MMQNTRLAKACSVRGSGKEWDGYSIRTVRLRNGRELLHEMSTEKLPPSATAEPQKLKIISEIVAANR